MKKSAVVCHKGVAFSITYDFRDTANMTARAWCFTENDNYSVWALRPALMHEGLPKGIRYLVFQVEKGEQGHEHIQGYVELTSPQRMTWLKSNLSPTAHYEKRRGTRDEARGYCMKEDTRLQGPFEFGTWELQQGSRTDLKKAIQVLQDTNSLSEVAKQCPMEFVKYHKGFSELKKKIHPNIEKPKYKLDEFLHEPLDLTKSVELVGDSGLGKTEFALAHFESPLKVTHIDELREFDSKIHDGIVFDDVSFLHTPIQQRIHLLEYERQASIHVRYDYVTIPAQTKKIFTINPDKDGGDAFLSINENLSMAQRNAILRRLNIVKIETSLFE